MTERRLPELDSRPQSRREWSGWLGSLVLPLAFVTAIVGGLLYLQTSGSSRPSSAYGSIDLPAAGNPSGQPAQAAVGRAAPDFVLETAGGGAVRFSDLQGRPLLVTFFATWCAECRAGLPAIVQTAATRGDVVSVLAVNLQESEGRVRLFATEYGMTFPVLLDRRGDVSSAWRVGGRGEPLPATFFIDATGIVRKIIAGPAGAAELDEGISLISGGRR